MILINSCFESKALVTVALNPSLVHFRDSEQTRLNRFQPSIRLSSFFFVFCILLKIHLHFTATLWAPLYGRLLFPCY